MGRRFDREGSRRWPRAGRWFVRDLPGGCVVRVAIGARIGETFVPIAHSPALETPPGTAAALLADALLRWTPTGAAPASRHAPGAPSVERLFARPRRADGVLMDPERHPGAALPSGPSPSGSARAGPGVASSGTPMGSSERWAEIPGR